MLLYQEKLDSMVGGNLARNYGEKTLLMKSPGDIALSQLHQPLVELALRP